jgi:hypothetical protein
MLILEEKEKKRVIWSIIALVAIIVIIFTLLFYWSLLVGGIYLPSKLSTISLPQFFPAIQEKEPISETKIETQIFQNPKFQALRFHALLPVQKGSVGRDDPFSPPFFLSPTERGGEATEEKEIFQPEE